jgi:GT2 family glycosyltransferase
VVAAGPFPPDLDLTPLSRRPMRLPAETARVALESPLPAPGSPSNARRDPRASIVVVTHGRLPFTRLCLASVLANSGAGDWLEVVVVDNGSSDGTVAYLRALADRRPEVRLVLNAANRGFGPAVNQGLAVASGEALVLLNNDTIVPPGWLERLLRHLDDPAVGLAGPVSNAAGNEAQVEVRYRTYGQFEAAAAERAAAWRGQRVDVPMLTMFCLALRRDVLLRIGPLDECFEVGMFEDDDYSRRARQAGYAVVCAEDVLVHHFGQASFGDLVPTGEYGALFEANRRRFEEKWRTAWRPHQRRAGPAYRSLVERVRALADTALPPDATVLVASKGDEALLQLGARRRGWHFPRGEGGAYAGHYPADSVGAISHLEELRAAGADHLLLPATSLWWLDHYGDLGRHLEERYRDVLRDDTTCRIYELRGRRPA